MQGADSPNRLAPGHPGHPPSSVGNRRNRAQLLYKTSLALRSVLPRLRGPQFALGVAARMSARRSTQLPAAPSRAPTCSPRVPQASRGGSEQAVPCPAAPRSPRGSPRLLKAKGGRGGSSSFVLPHGQGTGPGVLWLLHGTVAAGAGAARCVGRAQLSQPVSV